MGPVSNQRSSDALTSLHSIERSTAIHRTIDFVKQVLPYSKACRRRMKTKRLSSCCWNGNGIKTTQWEMGKMEFTFSSSKASSRGEIRKKSLAKEMFTEIGCWNSVFAFFHELCFMAKWLLVLSERTFSRSLFNYWEIVVFADDLFS